MAARILVMLIDATGIDHCYQNAIDFHGWVVKANTEYLSLYGYTFVVMFMVKINKLASEFYDLQGMVTLSEFLTDECLHDYQIAYNVLVALWVLSFQDYARRDFEDMEQDLIEKCLKVLDYFNKEKVVRITLLLLENLSSSRKCLEIMSDLSSLELIEKL